LNNAYLFSPYKLHQIFFADLVIPNPEIKQIKIEASDEFFIIASDGLWDVVSEEDAVDRAR